MSITILDIAERARVSAKTVSRVLNDEAGVRASVRENVKRVIAECNYKPNPFARRLSSAKSYFLGLLLDDPSWSGYAVSMQRGALLRSRALGYHLIVEPVDVRSDGWEARVLRSIEELRLDGAILPPPICSEPGLLEKLEAMNLPYVRISPGEHLSRSGVVEIDERRAAFETTNYLISLGHRDIGFISGLPNHAATPNRKAGFLSAMRAQGLDTPDAWMASSDFTFTGGMRAAEEMLRQSKRPTAIFASNDEMALGATAAAGRLGLTIPTDLSIAGFDDSPTSRVAWPAITTVRQPVEDMAAAAVDTLIHPIYRGAPDDPQFRKRLPYELIVRDSTQAPPG